MNIADLKCNSGLTQLMGFDNMHKVGKLLILNNVGGKKI